jgi:murein DD-endopeptidase MepM/ murein hydrolase activator NlpD
MRGYRKPLRARRHPAPGAVAERAARLVLRHRGPLLLFALTAALTYTGIRAVGGPPPPATNEAAAFAAVGPLRAPPPSELPAPTAQPVEPYGPPAPPVSEEPGPGTLHVLTGRIPQGGSLAGALGAEGVDGETIQRLVDAMKPVFDFRGAQPDDFFALIRLDDGQVISFEFQRGRRVVYRLELVDGALRASRGELPLERRVVNLGGVIERSLFDSIGRLGERGELAGAFADIFIWDFDFSTESRPGDEFRLVFEKFFDRDGFVRYGDVLAAQYRSGPREFTAVYFHDDRGYGDYYTPEGKSVRRAFLRAPLRYQRISSRFSRSRLHPILKIRRPHTGVDYAAPTGTPVWSVADGKVIFKGWSGGFGRLVKVRHNNGYVSYYGHLSRFSDGIEVGRRVAQKQVVGYVGSTGLATGPHLDYRLFTGGRFVDPLKVEFPKGHPVASDDRERFALVRDDLLAELGTAAPPMVLEAGM